MTGAIPRKDFPANTTTFTDISFATNYVKDVEQNINVVMRATVGTGFNSQLTIKDKDSLNGSFVSCGDTNTLSTIIRIESFFNIFSNSAGIWQYKTSHLTSFVVDVGYGFYLRGWKDYNLKI